MLVLIGLGLGTVKDLTQHAIEAAKECDVLYLETYTSYVPSRQELAKVFGKDVQAVGREAVESGDILNYAVRNRAGLLVGGDPLTATTHTDLLLRAKEKGIKTSIVHNTSIYSAVAECGLQIYKFGRSATVVFWQENYKPTSFYDVVQNNKKQGLHTLLFLDIDREHRKFMSPNEAMSILTRCGLSENEKIVVCSRLGHEDSKIRYDAVEQLHDAEFGEAPHVIVVPGKLHDMEENFLKQFIF